MRQLSSSGRQAIDDIAQRHGFSVDATMSMLDSVINGNGGMAQFSHPEFAGSGQWMRGGMTMVSDMFNNHLKNRVDSLCFDLATLISDQPDLVRTGSFQSQRQGGGGHAQEQTSHGGSSWSSGRSQGTGLGSVSHSESGAGSSGAASLFVAGSNGDWWPSDLRWPDSTGAQNSVRYAYFAQARRLAIDVGGTVTVYDTLDHRIGGFSQQQSVGGTLSFSSQYGLMDVASLPVMSSNGEPPRRTESSGNDQYSSQDSQAMTTTSGYGSALTTSQNSGPVSSMGTSSHDIFATIEKLADLKTKGILSQDEFDKKKAELLSRL